MTALRPLVLSPAAYLNRASSSLSRSPGPERRQPRRTAGRVIIAKEERKSPLTPQSFCGKSAEANEYKYSNIKQQAETEQLMLVNVYSNYREEVGGILNCIYKLHC